MAPFLAVSAKVCRTKPLQQVTRHPVPPRGHVAPHQGRSRGQVQYGPGKTRKQEHILQLVRFSGLQFIGRSRPLRKFTDGRGKGMVAQSLRVASGRNM